MILFISFLIILAMLSTKISDKFGLPLLIGFILIGVLVGSDVLNLFYFDNALLTKKVNFITKEGVERKVMVYGL